VKTVLTSEKERKRAGKGLLESRKTLCQVPGYEKKGREKDQRKGLRAKKKPWLPGKKRSEGPSTVRYAKSKQRA